MTKYRLNIGRHGEEIAVDFLKKNGYSIVERNFRNYLGEIDIVAREKDVVCFVEVRTRRSPAARADILDSIGEDKQLRLSRLALSFLKDRRLLGNRARFDVVCLTLGENGNEPFLLKNAFDICQRYA